MLQVFIKAEEEDEKEDVALQHNTHIFLQKKQLFLSCQIQEVGFIYTVL